jgi:hypothetical protein
MLLSADCFYFWMLLSGTVIFLSGTLIFLSGTLLSWMLSMSESLYFLDAFVQNAYSMSWMNVSWTLISRGFYFLNAFVQDAYVLDECFLDPYVQRLFNGNNGFPEIAALIHLSSLYKKKRKSCWNMIDLLLSVLLAILALIGLVFNVYLVMALVLAKQVRKYSLMDF